MKHSLFALIAGAGLTTLAASAAEPGFAHFITAHDGQLYDGAQVFRFISLDTPNLLLIEDNVRFGQENPWRLPDAFEINDALGSIAQLGGQVTRTYVISVQRPEDPPDTPRHVLAPGKFNETAFRTMDEVLAAANRNHVRLIIPFVDNWPWMGGRAEYAGFRGKTKDDFWTDPQLIADLEQTIHFVLTRTNTVTGVRYMDDPAVLCWETGNEVAAPPEWTHQIAHYLKSLDTNHLVMDGFNTTVLRQESLDDPDVDIVTTHHYPGGGESFSNAIRANAARAHGKKAYIVGEFGFVSTDTMQETMQTIMDTGMSGGMLWSLRFRNRDGGFYWHTEGGSGGNVYKAFHWPPSIMGKDYDEITLMNLVQSNAFAIRGLPVPAATVPAPPTLLPVSDAGAISWQGSIGATGYRVERSASRDHGWQIVATNVDEAFTQYRPDFADENVPVGDWFYRVRAVNTAGVSEPSTIGGPVNVSSATLVDELADFSKIDSKSGGWQLAGGDSRSTREDMHRAAGAAGDVLVYRLPSTIQNFRVFAFFPDGEKAVKFSTSNDGHKFNSIMVRKTSRYHGAGEYHYWVPVEYQAGHLAGGNYLRIELTGSTQISRVEISHTALKQ